MNGVPNLARRPFVNTRPILVAAVALAVIGVGLTVYNVAEYVAARRSERELSSRLAPLEAQRSSLSARVRTLDGKLKSVAWKKLASETDAMESVLLQRQLVWTTLLGDLERVMPWDVRLVSIRPTVAKDGAVELGLSGVATGRQSWLNLLARLFSDSRFSRPVPLSEEAPSATNAVGYQFEVRVLYWPGGRS